MRRNHLAILLAAGSLALGLTALAPERAEAVPVNPALKAQCEARGYAWSATKGCADKKCKWNGKTYEPGSDITIGTGTNKMTMYCDGWAGGWRPIPITRPPSSTLPTVTWY
jgi:hypothetical protein